MVYCFFFFRYPILELFCNKYDKMPRMEKKEYVIQNLLKQNIKKTLTSSYFTIANQRMCYYVWCLILKFNFHYVYKINKLILEEKYYATVIPQFIPDATMKNIIISFLTEYFDIMAEWLPTGQKALIPKFNKKQMYHQLFVNHCNEKHLLIPSYTYFIEVWLTYFKHIRMTDKQRFSICSICQNFNDSINKVCFQNTKKKKK